MQFHHLRFLDLAREYDTDVGNRHRLDELLLRRALAGVLADEEHVSAGALHLPQHGGIVVADGGFSPSRLKSDLLFPANPP